MYNISLSDGQVFLLKMVEMLSGNTYFRCILMIFDHLPYFSVSKSIFDDKMISQWEHMYSFDKGM